MNAHTTTPLFRRILHAVSAAPVVLLAYAAFVVISTLTGFVFLPFASEPFRASLIPFTGWVASGSYAFTIFFAFALIFQRQRRGAVRFFGITLQLLLQIGCGIYLLSQFGRPNFGNPYLTVSALQPLWTILIPAIWITLLHTPSINRFCHRTPKPNVA